jgi:CheY-like chemotaxis protein
MRSNENATILIADDDAEIRMLVAEALAENPVPKELHFVQDGEELMDYLHRRGKYMAASASPQPGLILLDLNMPKKDGREALQEIKANPDLRHISVVILTTSKAEDDIYNTYKLGANSFIIKPRTFQDLSRVMSNLVQYWFETVELPPTLRFS